MAIPKVGEPGYQPKKVFGNPNQYYREMGPEAAVAVDDSRVRSARPTDDFGGIDVDDELDTYYEDMFYGDEDALNPESGDRYPVWNGPADTPEEESDLSDDEYLLSGTEEEATGESSRLDDFEESATLEGTPDQVARQVLEEMPNKEIMMFTPEEGMEPTDISMVYTREKMTDLVSKIYSEQAEGDLYGAQAQWVTLSAVDDSLKAEQALRPHTHLGSDYLDGMRYPFTRAEDCLRKSGYEMESEEIMNACADEMAAAEYEEELEAWDEDGRRENELYALIYDSVETNEIFIDDSEDTLYLSNVAQITLRNDILSHVNSLTEKIRNRELS